MVIGLEAFREAFKGYEDCYTIIGGTACDILMNKANLDFRATRDIDMILLIEKFKLHAKSEYEHMQNPAGLPRRDLYAYSATIR